MGEYTTVPLPLPLKKDAPVTRQRPGPEWVCLGPVGSMWVLDFAWEGFHNMSPGDYEDLFIKVADSETRKGLTQKKQQDSLG